jgi:SAM-dependent methyltransferase
MESHFAFIEKMVAKGGPTPAEYELFTDWLHELAAKLGEGKLTVQDVGNLRAAFGEALSTLTLQGFAFTKPHGYPGDFEMLEKIYQKHVSSNPALKNWDLYFQAQSAPRAVRNRKEYFKRLLRGLDATHDKRSQFVLNVASGSGRDLSEFLRERRNGKLTFDCIEWEKKAINVARQLCAEFATCVEFFCGNALQFTTTKRYRLIWSAGLFDYLDDAKFKYLLQRLYTFLDDEGELIIGNFSESNPTRNYMEIVGDWYLHHRSPEKLRHLVQECGVKQSDIRIDCEPEGINLFVHLKRGADFIRL